MEEWKKVANQLDKDHAKGTRADRPTHSGAPRSAGCRTLPEAAQCRRRVYLCHPRGPYVPASPVSVSVFEDKESKVISWQDSELVFGHEMSLSN